MLLARRRGLYILLTFLFIMKRCVTFQKGILTRENMALSFLHWHKEPFKRKNNNSCLFFQNKRNHKGTTANNATYDYVDIDKQNDDSWYSDLLERKAYIIKNSKNNFQKIKWREKNEEKKIQQMDYTTLHLLAIELNTLLAGATVEHVTQADEKTIVLHLTKREVTSKSEEYNDTKEKKYYLYICYNEEHPVISLGLQIKKLFNRFIDDDYAQKLNPLIKYSAISNVYIKSKFVKILCIDFILKNFKQENMIDVEPIEYILPSENDTVKTTDTSTNTNSGTENHDNVNHVRISPLSKKVTLLFDLHYNSCASFVINKENNEIIASPYNYITQKVIDKSFKEGHIYIFPNKLETKEIPNHYEFFSSFLNLFKARKDQKLITSLTQLYEGISPNLLVLFFHYLNIPIYSTFEQIGKSALLDFFNNAYIKWIRFLILKETNKNLFYYPHFDNKLNVYNCIKMGKTEKTQLKDVPSQPTKAEKETMSVNNKDDIRNENKPKEEKKSETNKKKGLLSSDVIQGIHTQETKFETVIELVYYYYANILPVNQFYAKLNYVKEYINKKLPIYYEMIEQYKNDKEITEKVYLLHEYINQLTVFNHTVSKMKDWVDKKTYDALQLIENELKCNSLEDNRKKYVKKMEQQKQTEETFEKKIKNVKPNVIKTAQNLFKGCFVMRINESDLSSPFLIVGKNSKQNEKISTQILKFNDLWFHVHEHPGGHVILRNKKINGSFISAQTNIDSIEIDDDIKYAADVAAYFSKVRKSEKTLVCFTLGKYVKKDSTMMEGSVHILKYKVVYGRPRKVAQTIKDLTEKNKEIELFQQKKK